MNNISNLLYQLAYSIGIKIVPLNKDGSNVLHSSIINVEMPEEHKRIIKSKGYIGK